MEPHPLAKPYPLLEGAEYERFKESIAEHGIQEPILRFEGKVLDGRNRLRALTDLGVAFEDVPVKDFEGTEEQAAVLVKVLNLDRRHLLPADERRIRAESVAELAAKGMSQRAIAEAIGASVFTVNRDLKRQVLGRLTPDHDPEPEEEHGDATTGVANRGAGVPHHGRGVAADGDDARDAARDPGERTARTDLRVPVSEAEPGVPPKVTGRDGKQYPASRSPRESRPAAKNTPSRAAEEPEPEPDAPPPPWADVASHLDRLTEMVARTGAIPQEMKPWQLVESLERTGRSLLQRARELRRHHRLQ